MPFNTRAHPTAQKIKGVVSPSTLPLKEFRHAPGSVVLCTVEVLVGDSKLDVLVDTGSDVL